MPASPTIHPNAQTSPAHSAPPPAADAGRTWTITTDEGLSVTGHLPAWAEDDPSESGIPLDRLGTVLSDINHHLDTSGQLLRVRSSPGASGPTDEEVPVFCGSIDCDPYSPDPHQRIPVFTFHLVDDHLITALDPEGVTALAAALRTQADILDHEVRPTLLAARDDWTRNNTTAPA